MCLSTVVLLYSLGGFKCDRNYEIHCRKYTENCARVYLEEIYSFQDTVLNLA